MADDKDQEEKKPSKGKSGLILVVVIFLVGIGAGFATAFLLVPTSEQPISNEVVEIPDSLDGAPNIEKVIIENIAVNPIGRKYKTSILAISLAFDIKPKVDGPIEFDGLKISIKDMIIGFLSSRKVDDLKNPKYKVVLKRELRQKINKILKDSKVTRVYFTQYILQ